MPVGALREIPVSVVPWAKTVHINQKEKYESETKNKAEAETKARILKPVKKGDLVTVEIEAEVTRVIAKVYWLRNTVTGTDLGTFDRLDFRIEPSGPKPTSGHDFEGDDLGHQNPKCS